MSGRGGAVKETTGLGDVGTLALAGHLYWIISDSLPTLTL